MKIGQLLLKIGKKLFKKKQKNNNKDEEKLLASNDSWGCWFIFGKPKTPKIFK